MKFFPTWDCGGLPCRWVRQLGFWSSLLMVNGVAVAQPFTHPGCLSTEADLNRMKAKVAAAAQPWKGSWDILVANSHAKL